ncbi:hypothetical protein [Okeania sp. KiyG1]|nr:hypothetical protein [Okeania sp. KiyG1]
MKKEEAVRPRIGDRPKGMRTPVKKKEEKMALHNCGMILSPEQKA